MLKWRKFLTTEQTCRQGEKCNLQVYISRHTAAAAGHNNIAIVQQQMTLLSVWWISVFETTGCHHLQDRSEVSWFSSTTTVIIITTWITVRQTHSTVTATNLVLIAQLSNKCIVWDLSFWQTWGGALCWWVSGPNAFLGQSGPLKMSSQHSSETSGGNHPVEQSRIKHVRVGAASTLAPKPCLVFCPTRVLSTWQPCTLNKWQYLDDTDVCKVTCFQELMA